MDGIRCRSCAALLIMAFAVDAQAQELSEATPPSIREDDRPAPVDYGPGPGVRPDRNRQAVQEMMAAPSAAAVPVAGAAAQITGVFGPPVTWPLIGLHVVLLPDGRVMSYGTSEQGQQGAQFVYDVWNPTLGTESAAHTVLPNTTGTDIFCSGQSVLSSGEVLITGGDLTINGKRNFSNQQTTVFHPQTNTVTAEAPMLYARWYPSVVSLPNGDKLVLGGREDPGTTASTPEVYRQGTGWRTLWGATSNAAFATGGLYTRAVVAPDGRVFVLGHNGKMFYLDPAGNGQITQLTQQTLSGDWELPTLMFAPGNILSVRNQQKVVVIDVNGQQPVITPTTNIDQLRFWSNATVLADGEVLVTGGSAVANQLTGVAYAATIWNPATGQWTLGASAVKPRLYHSIALLLPDGSVLTGAGGAPGPVKNLNMEIYYPPYLFDAFGQPAPRPAIVDSTNPLTVNQQFVVTMASADPISRVTLVRTGSATHAFNSDQRFLQFLPGSGVTQTGQFLAVQLPANVNVLIPGYYLLFVFNQAGVPSVAKIVQVS
jgi:galactose oxidase-like protein/glyoxal oxidase-like protein